MITIKKYFNKYLQIIEQQIPNLIKQFDFENSSINFDYLTKASAVYSSNIENIGIDIIYKNCIMNHYGIYCKNRKRQ